MAVTEGLLCRPAGWLRVSLMASSVILGGLASDELGLGSRTPGKVLQRQDRYVTVHDTESHQLFFSNPPQSGAL